MKTARIYAFGDSLTYGAWDSQGGWCDRLKQKLHNLTINQENGVKFQMLNLGIGGENSRSLLKRLKNEIEARHRLDWPEVIIIGTGFNDSRYKINGETDVSIEEYKDNLKKIITTAREYTDKIILIGLVLTQLKIQPFKETFVSHELLQKYDKIITEVANEEKVKKVETIDGFELLGKNIYFRDGVHLNDDGHKIMTDLIWVELEKLLKD